MERKMWVILAPLPSLSLGELEPCKIESDENPTWWKARALRVKPRKLRLINTRWVGRKQR